MLVVMFCFFFFKQKTAYEMRISDWSSDVCSSDLAVELGPQGITVNAVAPGPIATEMLASNNDPAALARMAELVPVGRLGEPADIAGVVAFFLSDDAAFITGQTLYVCGGRSIGFPLL